jgi:Uma2 family endonuclease
MIVPVSSPSAKDLVDIDCDGEPMSESTLQFEWILFFAGNLRALFADRPDVFVAGNQFWYPVEGDPNIRMAPDAYVVFGRPKGDRASYKQWEEDNIPMTVVFEVMSPSSTLGEMIEMSLFYAEHGAEEFYIYDPLSNHLDGFRRQGTEFRRVAPMDGYVSPRLGIKFDLSGPKLVVRYPDGRPFRSVEELEAERVAEKQRAEAALREVEAERHRADAAERRATALAEQLRQLGIDPNSGPSD